MIFFQTPAPPIAGNFGGTRADRNALFEKYLNAGKPEQIAAYRDDNPVLREVQREFNKTMQTIVDGYAVHKAMLFSDKKDCDRSAENRADSIMQKAFDDTVQCLIVFRHRVRTEVKPEITSIKDVNIHLYSTFNLLTNLFIKTYFFCSQVEPKLKDELIDPIVECFHQDMTKEIFKKFGDNTANHLICTKKHLLVPLV